MRPPQSDIAAAAAVLAAFVALAALLQEIAAPGALQLRAADPLLRTFSAWGGRWLPIGIAAAICATWIAIETPSGATLAPALRHALRGAIAAALVLGALRLAFGAALPAAIPAEESARPGVALGLAAGTLEEALFRLVLLPVALALCARRFRPRIAVVVAIAATSLCFALAHELDGSSIVWRHFAVRALVPGAFMSALFLRPGPAFIVSAHGTAHLLLPLLFR